MSAPKQWSTVLAGIGVLVAALAFTRDVVDFRLPESLPQPSEPSSHQRSPQPLPELKDESSTSPRGAGAPQRQAPCVDLSAGGIPQVVVVSEGVANERLAGKIAEGLGGSIAAVSADFFTQDHFEHLIHGDGTCLTGAHAASSLVVARAEVRRALDSINKPFEVVTISLTARVYMLNSRGTSRALSIETREEGFNHDRALRAAVDQAAEVLVQRILELEFRASDDRRREG